MPERIAIVGGGVSGLSALWALTRQGHEVHIFESQDYIGGHTHSFPWRNASKKGGYTMVDTAFVLLNEKTYPNFASFLSHLDIPTNPIRITFGLTRNNGELEWSSKSLSTFFSQRQNLLSPSMWRMLFDIVRFNLFAIDVLDPSNPFKDESIGTYLQRNHYSAAFTNNYLIPLTSSLWINDPAQVTVEMPAVMLVRYFWNHHMLNIFKTTLQWLSIKGGCYQYVQKILEQVPAERIHTSTRVQQVYNDGSRVVLALENGSLDSFDRVIIATHAPDALRLRGLDASLEERAILENFRTISSNVVVHSDLSFMPARREAWSAWNYIDRAPSTSWSLLPSSEKFAIKRPSLTFYMNNLLGLESANDEPILTTLNPPYPPDPSAIQATLPYSHPVYDSRTLAEQEKMPTIQGKRNIWYAGAWMRYGFHEDGFTAGLEAARDIDRNLNLPFPILDWRHSRGKTTGRLTWTTILAREIVLFLQVMILTLQWLFSLSQDSPQHHEPKKDGKFRL